MEKTKLLLQFQSTPVTNAIEEFLTANPQFEITPKPLEADIILFDGLPSVAILKKRTAKIQAHKLCVFLAPMKSFTTSLFCQNVIKAFSAAVSSRIFTKPCPNLSFSLVHSHFIQDNGAWSLKSRTHYIDRKRSQPSCLFR
ncbi:MAG: hypothetical protein H6925_04115 [Holosporaceae bacterium]|nr:MAG: hypothetical protein H6925_04115 [Holosporaceae bacterium]